MYPFIILGVSDLFMSETHQFYRNRCKIYAKSVNPDQTPRVAASDLGLHCFAMSLFWEARYKCV